MKIAIKEASKADYPYAAVLVKNDKILAKSGTSSKDSIDPTAHAEMIVVRETCKKLNSKELKDTILYTTVEPCPMCFTALWWAKVSEIVYGISLLESSRLLFPEMRVSSKFLNEKSGNKIKITGGVLRNEIISLFKNFKEKDY